MRQFQRLFELSGKELVFAPDALEAIADLAMERETGVRALRSILEELLLDLLYEIPSRKDTNVFVIDAEVISGKKSLTHGLRASDFDPDSAEDSLPAALEDEDQSAERESA